MDETHEKSSSERASTMSAYSIADAQVHLPELIARALGGEDVVITQNGRPIVELKPALTTPRPVTAADLDWLASLRVEGSAPEIDAGAFVSAMRDEDDNRW